MVDALKKGKKEKVTKPRYFLSNLRNQAGLSQEYIAKLMDIDRVSYCRIESGSRGDRLDIRKMIKLSEILHVSVEYLIFEEAKYLDYIEKLNNRSM